MGGRKEEEGGVEWKGKEGRIKRVGERRDRRRETRDTAGTPICLIFLLKKI